MRAFMLSLLMLAAPASAQLSEQGEPVSIGTSYRVRSLVMDEERTITVRLPAEYAAEPDRRFPVVYLLDGGPGQDFPHIAGIAQSREINFSFEPFILVGVESVNRRHELTPTAADPARYAAALGTEPGGSADYRMWLRDELMPQIDTAYRTDGHNAVIGESLAALFVVETLLVQPELFDDYIAISPSMWWDEMRFGRDAVDYLARFPAGGERRLYLTVANEGMWHREGIERLVDALRDHSPANLRWTFVPVEASETHGTLLHPMALDAFRALYGTPDREYPSPALMGGADDPVYTTQESARLAQECTRANSRPTTPGASAQGIERLYYECLLYDLGPRPREGTMVR
ncbi:MAG: alpha/beta hydrolase [Erythrobacter sp.]|nr:alpha/beta hydrolase [Erythrobacter sp.]